MATSNSLDLEDVMIEIFTCDVRNVFEIKSVFEQFKKLFELFEFKQFVELATMLQKIQWTGDVLKDRFLRCFELADSMKWFDDETDDLYELFLCSSSQVDFRKEEIMHLLEPCTCILII